MASESQSFVVLILEQDACRLGMSLDADAAMTLIAVASENPSCWDDIVAYWARYRTPSVPEFADGLPLQLADSAATLAALDQHHRWVAIDLVRKRITTGRGFDPVGRDVAFAMVVEEEGKQHCPLSVHLPPWWELWEQAAVSEIARNHESPPAIPRVNREVLFGEPLLEVLAARILDIANSEAWTRSGASEDHRSRYEFTKQVHRAWLMTPREDLGGMMPRQMLHGAHEWIDRLVWAQRLRFDDGGEIVAAPTAVAGYDDAPMGSEEMVIYFDLCRELIGAGWHWCVESQLGPDADRSQCRCELVAFLRDVKEDWLGSPFEGGSPPSFIIECSRRRVPRGAGVPIVGMIERQSEEHVIDCDCPICNMMADGIFGPGFAHLDGHHLDLDDDFAFSMHETREAWEQQQREFEEMSATIERNRTERESRGESEQDEFASVWMGQMSEGPLPGDPDGHLKLAFLLAEIVGSLQSTGAPKKDVERLSKLFTDFRNCDQPDASTCGTRLAEHLEELAGCYPDLVSRVSDLQSRIDEQIRCRAFNDDIPF